MYENRCMCCNKFVNYKHMHRVPLQIPYFSSYTVALTEEGMRAAKLTGRNTELLTEASRFGADYLKKSRRTR